VDKKLFYLSDRFSLHVGTDQYKTHIDMSLFIPSVNTCDFPHTLFFLRNNFPSVLRTQCFNYKKISFDKEVVATELGHLFEHILLDQLCFHKMNSGLSRISYSGRTSWNWEKDKRGVFHIFINVKKKDNIFLDKALADTISLFERLIISDNQTPIFEEKLNKFVSTGNVNSLPVEIGI
jgi:hypothetical protein